MDTLLAILSPLPGLLGQMPDWAWTLLALLAEHPGRSALLLLAVYAAAVWRDTYWREQWMRGFSRFLSGASRGQGDVSFSAWSFELKRQGSRLGHFRVWFVDTALRRGDGHCQRAWEWANEPRRPLEIELDSAV